MNDDFNDEYPPILPYTRKQLAALYGIDTKQFRSWCQEEKIDLGRCHALPPNKVKLVFETFGVPIHKCLPEDVDRKLMPRKRAKY